MSGIWDFLKRHRGKIIAGAVVAGGVYVVQQTLQNSRQILGTEWDREHVLDRTQLQVSSRISFASFVGNISQCFLFSGQWFL